MYKYQLYKCRARNGIGMKLGSRTKHNKESMTISVKSVRCVRNPFYVIPSFKDAGSWQNTTSEAFPEPSRTSKMELFIK